jgi:riboflavin synthase
MFTGLIEAFGRIVGIDGDDRGRTLAVRTPLGAELCPGDSIAVNGVCLTVTTQSGDGFTADIAPVTLRVTSLGTMKAGRLVNLERPVRADARMGGHFVLGHVDGVGRLADLRRDGDSHWLEIETPPALDPCLVLKGSLAVDGISLTIAALSAGRVGIQIVPFTLAHTALGEARPGDTLNLEGDVLGKYVARLVGLGLATAPAVPGPTR